MLDILALLLWSGMEGVKKSIVAKPLALITEHAGGGFLVRWSKSFFVSSHVVLVFYIYIYSLFGFSLIGWIWYLINLIFFVVVFNFIEIFLKKSLLSFVSLIVVIFPGKIIRKISICSLGFYFIFDNPKCPTSSLAIWLISGLIEYFANPMNR